MNNYNSLNMQNQQKSNGMIAKKKNYLKLGGEKRIGN